MTKAEAKELLVDYFKTTLEFSNEDANRVTDNYINAPNRTIKFSDDEDAYINPLVDPSCSHIHQENISVSQCTECPITRCKYNQ